MISQQEIRDHNTGNLFKLHIMIYNNKPQLDKIPLYMSFIIAGGIPRIGVKFHKTS